MEKLGEVKINVVVADTPPVAIVFSFDPRLTLVARNKIGEALEAAKQELEARFGTSIPVIAYPDSCRVEFVFHPLANSEIKQEEIEDDQGTTQHQPPTGD